MKVFWSWQSDHPGKISRHFVRGALEDSIKALNAEPEVTEADRPDIELDHDRKGVPGSPDLAATILAKIGSSQVFVADVTPVGAVSASAKRLMNSNVAIELGYALATVSDARVIMVMNAHYGRRDDLPFDLSHKAGPIFYDLHPEADGATIAGVRSQLAGRLKDAIREIIGSQRQSAQSFAPWPAIDGDPSRFVPADVPLAKRPRHDGASSAIFAAPSPQLYLRVIPKTSQPLLKRADLRALARGQGGKHPLEPFYHSPTSICYEENAQGLLTFDYDGGPLVSHGVQLFLTRELWAFDGNILAFHKPERQGVPTQAAENTFRRCLPLYSAFMQESLHVEPPYVIEAGACGLEGFSLYYKDYEQPAIHDNCVTLRRELRALDDSAINAFLLELFEAFFDAAAVKRPKGLYGFPPQQEVAAI